MDKAIVKAVRTLGYDQPADVTIRKKRARLIRSF